MFGFTFLVLAHLGIPGKRVVKRVCVVMYVLPGYIGEFEIIDDHRAGKIVVNLTGRINKVCML